MVPSAAVTEKNEVQYWQLGDFWRDNYSQYMDYPELKDLSFDCLSFKT